MATDLTLREQREDLYIQLDDARETVKNWRLEIKAIEAKIAALDALIEKEENEEEE